MCVMIFNFAFTHMSQSMLLKIFSFPGLGLGSQLTHAVSVNKVASIIFPIFNMKYSISDTVIQFDNTSCL